MSSSSWPNAGFAIVFVLVVGLIAAFGIDTLRSTRHHDAEKPPEKQQRFTAESANSAWSNLNLYLVTDHQTGKAYLVNLNGGIVEIAP